MTAEKALKSIALILALKELDDSKKLLLIRDEIENYERA